MRQITEYIQFPVTAIEYIDTLANNSSTSSELPCLGFTLLYGFIYSSQNISLKVETGVNDKSSSLVYRDTVSISVAAGTPEKIEIPIVAKFIKITIENTSGSDADIEALFQLRPYE